MDWAEDNTQQFLLAMQSELGKRGAQDVFGLCTCLKYHFANTIAALRAHIVDLEGLRIRPAMPLSCGYNLLYRFSCARNFKMCRKNDSATSKKAPNGPKGKPESRNNSIRTISKEVRMNGRKHISEGLTNS